MPLFYISSTTNLIECKRCLKMENVVEFKFRNTFWIEFSFLYSKRNKQRPKIGNIERESLSSHIQATAAQSLNFYSKLTCLRENKSVSILLMLFLLLEILWILLHYLTDCDCSELKNKLSENVTKMLDFVDFLYCFSILLQ